MFKCESVVNKEVIHEYVVMAYAVRRIMIGILIALAVGYFAFDFILHWENNPVQMGINALVYIVGIVVILVATRLIYVFATKRVEKAMLERIETLVHKDSLINKIEIGEDKITHIKFADENKASDANESEENEKKTSNTELYLKDIEKVATTPNYIMVKFKGRLFVAINPNTIEGGTKEELIEHLRKSIKK